MSFLPRLHTWAARDIGGLLAEASPAAVAAVLNKEHLRPLDLLALLSPAAEPFLEQMARRAHQLTVQYFGRVIQLYIPLYLSNYCCNSCCYCGFQQGNRIPRRRLELPEIEQNLLVIKESGIRHILLLTGEDRGRTPLPYLEQAVRAARRHFASVCIEMFPMQEQEYATLCRAGADGLTIYQEVYDQECFAHLHPAGPKRDFAWRLDTPERGARAGLRAVNIGSLLGLDEPRREAFLTALHARYLQDRYLETEISISLPRLNPAEGGLQDAWPVPDRLFVQILTAFRIFLPRAGINVSTREDQAFRDNILPLGVTRMSAGSLTSVGGYTMQQRETPQFEISDQRDVAQVAASLSAHGYEPVYKDWDAFQE